MVKPTKAEVRAKAYEIHACPENYDGPCWGPTQRDLAEAERLLATTRDGDPSGSKDASGGSR